MVTEGGIVETEEQEKSAATTITAAAAAKVPVKTSFSLSLLETMKKDKKPEVVTEAAGGVGESDKRILRVFDAALRERFNKMSYSRVMYTF